MKNYTMITRHCDKDAIVAYTIISDTYQTVTLKTNELIKKIKSNEISVNNITVSGNEIESTNGALNKYTLINSDGNIEGTPRAVILNRVEQNNKLVGYTVFTHTGIIAEISVLDAVELANKGLVSNGKIRHTEQGDIVQSIGGNYPLRTIEIARAPKGEVKIEILYFAAVQGVETKYTGAIVSGTSATEMSKIVKAIFESNAKIVAESNKVAGYDTKESLFVKRTDVNSVYGVFGVDLLKKIASMPNVKLSRMGYAITVSVGKYIDGRIEEETINIGKNWELDDKAELKEVDPSRKFACYLQREFDGIVLN